MIILSITTVFKDCSRVDLGSYFSLYLEICDGARENRAYSQISKIAIFIPSWRSFFGLFFDIMVLFIRGIVLLLRTCTSKLRRKENARKRRIGQIRCI